MDIAKTNTELDSLYADDSVKAENIAVLTLADYYSSVAVFGTETESAWKEAVELGGLLMKAQQQEDHTDSVDRAWDFVSGWVASNKGRFTTEVFKPLETYGIIEKNRVCVICRVLNQALEEAGYSYRKCSKGFAERGYIITDTEEKAKNRTQEVKRINGISTRVYVLNMTVKNEEEEDDDFLT